MSPAISAPPGMGSSRRPNHVDCVSNRVETQSTHGALDEWETVTPATALTRWKERPPRPPSMGGGIFDFKQLRGIADQYFFTHIGRNLCEAPIDGLGHIAI